MFKEKLLSLIKSDDGKSKKNIENAVVFIIILVVTIIIINTVWKEEKAIDEDAVRSNDIKLVNTEIEEMPTNGNIEKNIKQILKIQLI